jgi:hypothetical protein
MAIAHCSGPESGHARHLWHIPASGLRFPCFVLPKVDNLLRRVLEREEKLVRPDESVVVWPLVPARLKQPSQEGNDSVDQVVVLRGVGCQICEQARQHLSG